MENGWYFSFMLVFLWQPSPHFQHPFMSCIMILNQLKKENKLLNSTKLYQQLFPYWTFEFNEYPKMNTFTKMFIFFYKGLGFLLSLYKVACILQSCHAVFILFFYQFFFFFDETRCVIWLQSGRHEWIFPSQQLMAYLQFLFFFCIHAIFLENDFVLLSIKYEQWQQIKKKKRQKLLLYSENVLVFPFFPISTSYASYNLSQLGSRQHHSGLLSVQAKCRGKKSGFGLQMRCFSKTRSVLKRDSFCSFGQPWSSVVDLEF